MAAAADRVRATIEPAVMAAGYDLEEVAVTAAGRRSVIRVVVDRDDGIDLDAVASVSRAVSAALDADDPMGESPYVLEVTSPGVDRPLTEERHWRRASGRLVTATAAGEAVTGRVVSAADGTVTLLVDGGERSFALADLGPGAVQIEFSAGPS
jgi:ribosome maturation factor RimP